jgi:hypothetical protein
MIRSRGLRLLAFGVVTNAVLAWLLSFETATRGLLSPSGAPRIDVALLGAAFLSFRVLCRFLVPFGVAFAVTRRLMSRILLR